MSRTEYFSKLKKADQDKIESVLPKMQAGKQLIRRTDKNGVVAYVLMPKGVKLTKDQNFNFENCKSVADEKEFLAKMIFGDYSAADKKEAEKEQAEAEKQAEKELTADK